MDPVSSVTQARQADLDMQIQMAVARKALDTQKIVGEAIVELLAPVARLGKSPQSGQGFDALG